MPGKSTEMRLKSQIHEKNIDKRGQVTKSLVKKEDKFPVGPVVLGVFLFLIVGSALFSILRTASSNYEI